MDAAYQTFQQQALHYFDREQQEVLRTPLETPAAWRGSELSAHTDWIVTLNDAQIAELDATSHRAKTRGRALEAMTREDFPLPSLSAAIAEWRRELRLDGGSIQVRFGF